MMRQWRGMVLAALIGLLTGFAGGVYIGQTRGIPFVASQDEWAIGIYAGASPLALAPAGRADNPVLTARNVTDVPATFVADPFMVRRDGVWYLFFEVMNAATNQGDIGLATSADGRQWAYQQIVLDEAFHLSYPDVFEWQGEYFMIPESQEASAVRLYRAVDFPTQWAFETTLLRGSYVDSSIVRHDDKWWLFTGTDRTDNDTLNLFYAEALTGPWVEHPGSPIVAGDPNAARPGGRVLQWGDRLVRFAQDDAPIYGNQAWAFEIIALTTTSYREIKLVDAPIVTASGSGWNAKGMHHVDAHQIGDGEWLACVDGYREIRVFGLSY